MSDIPATTARPARSQAPGVGLYRYREVQPHSWSQDWAFSGRRPVSGPTETFLPAGTFGPSRRPEQAQKNKRENTR